MTHPVKGVDHVFLMVNDLDESCEAFERLGFTISPRGMHSALMVHSISGFFPPNTLFRLKEVKAPGPHPLRRRCTTATVPGTASH